ncbi:MAG TPA: class I SAM-dependent methyltransferase [Polyangiaceae bacterium]
MSQGYVTDVAYARQFCPHLAPTLLRSVAALEGFAPPPEDAFDYCEVGCGPGDTIATLAAAYPRARFVGIDLNAEHVAFARGLAVRGGLSNLRLVEGDFEALGEEAALPKFDYVAAHGLLTWIAPAKRRALVAFAARRLKPGGLLHVAYNTLPGWAALEPMRRILHDAAGTEGTTAERAQRALDAARALADRGALYFVTNPAARDMLDAMARHGAAYVAHEYFHDTWNPMYVTDVAREMAAEGLAYVGQLPSYRNVPELALPPKLAEAATHTGDRIALEQLVDFAANEFFRGDVYRAGGEGRSADAAAAYVDATPFGTLVDADRLRREVKLPHHVLRLDGEIEAALLERLPLRAATARTLAEDPAFERFGANRVRAALVRLLAAEQIAPMRASAEGPATVYNHAILEQPLAEKSPVVLAAPAAGTGVQVSALQAVCLRVLSWVEPAERAAWLRAYVERQPLRLQVGGAAVEDRSEQARVLAQEVEKFRAARLPKLVELGVAPGQAAGP